MFTHLFLLQQTHTTFGTVTSGYTLVTSWVGSSHCH